MCTGVLQLHSPLSPVGRHACTPHRIWGPRVLPLQEPCSSDHQVGLAIVVAIQADLNLQAPCPIAHQPAPPAHLHPPAQDLPGPRHQPTNQEAPRHRSERPDSTRPGSEQAPTNQEAPRHRSDRPDSTLPASDQPTNQEAPRHRSDRPDETRPGSERAPTNQDAPRHLRDRPDSTLPASEQMPTNQELPRQGTGRPEARGPANEEMPRRSRTANRVEPRQQVGPPRPSLFTISSSSGCDDSSPRFSSSCFLCKRPLPTDKDIYMYRGDQAFCTQRCRHHQMVVDERKEKLRLRSLTPTFRAKNCSADYRTASHYYNDKEGVYA